MKEYFVCPRGHKWHIHMDSAETVTRGVVCPACGAPGELYPGLACSGRPYSAAWEEAHWDLGAVLSHPAGYAAARRVNASGMVGVYDRGYYVGRAQRGQVVFVVIDPVRREWVAVDAEDRELRRWPAEELTREGVRGLAVSHRRARAAAAQPDVGITGTT